MGAVDERLATATRSGSHAGIPRRILVADSDDSSRERLVRWLRTDGFACLGAANGPEAIWLTRRFRPGVVVLDIGLPDIDGFEVMHRVRDEFPHLPILLLTARDTAAERIAGLVAGGDDCLTRPFSTAEVAARLRALLRRTTMIPRADGLLVVGDLVLDQASREVMRAGQDVRLTTREFQLLEFLMRNAGQTLSKTQILDRVWKEHFDGRVNIVEMYISYLRRKIDKGREPMIHTKRGGGYILRPAPM